MFFYGEENQSKVADNVASMIYAYLRKIADIQVRNASRLVIFVDNCTGENKNCTIRAFLRMLLHSGTMFNLQKIAMVTMEVGRIKFSFDAGFGLVRRCEAKYDLQTIHDVRRMAPCSTTKKRKNVGVIFEASDFKQWKQHEKFKPIPNIRAQHMIQF